MPQDTLICGNCNGAFSELGEFVQHKHQCDQNVGAVQTTSSETVTTIDCATEIAAGDGGETTELGLFTNGSLEQTVSIPTEQLQQLGAGGTQTVIILNDQTASALQVEMSDKSTCTLDSMDMEDGSQTQLLAALPKPPARRRGRPKRGEERSTTKKVDAVPKEQEKPPLPEKGSDGKYQCVNCRRSFTKERFFITHKCLATSDYVDITKRDMVKIDSGDEEEDEMDAGARDDDDAEDYTAPVLEARTGGDGSSSEAGSLDSFQQYQVSTDPDGDLQTSDRLTDHIKDIPVFRNDDDKLAFEQSLNVDLSGIDYMFKVHIVEQDINESAAVGTRNHSAALSMYSCNTCTKVFKTLSHMRLHCLIHTKLKPFKCPKCDYASNSKGNLYTHMRKHTGQYYRCSKCDFKTVNKSHLVEHEATHSAVRQQCELCRKDYNTTKSLINHIRKYHANSRKGRDYLARFQIRSNARGSNVIHQCHVCNRRFKKKMDRDRHLFVHDIKDMPNIQHCELCDYTASRRIYLERHYQKHRVIYRCAPCQAVFLSTIRLFDHLSSEHFKDDTQMCDRVFENCINNSLYLPEPDHGLLHSEDARVNLPPELSSAAIAAAADPTAATGDAADSQVLETSSAGDLLSQGDAEMAMTTATANAMLTDVSTSLVCEEPAPGISSTGDILDGVTVTETIGAEDGIKMVPETAVQEAEVVEGSQNAVMVEESQSAVMVEESQNAVMVEGSQNTEVVEEEQVAEVVEENQNAVVVEESQNAEVVEEDPNVEQKQEVGDVVAAVEGETVDATVAMDADCVIAHTVVTEPDSAAKEGEGQDDAGTLTLGPEASKAVEEVNTNDVFISEVENNVVTMTDMAVQSTNGPDDSMDDEMDPLPPNPGAVVPEAEVEEGEEEEEVDTNLQITFEDCVRASLNDVIERLGYQRMSLKIFQKMRETFGSEECEFCGRLFYSKADYEPHVRTHTGDKPFACTKCNFRAATKDNLKRHDDREHKKLTFPCTDCEFVAHSRTQLFNHRVKHLGSTGMECPECKNRFDSMRLLRTHILSEHPSMSRTDLENLTGFRHKSQGKMGRHSYKCPYCDRVFIRANSELQKHIWIHKNIKPFKCMLCPYACRSKNNLQAHMLRHSSEKPFACTECSKKYKSKTALRWHIRSHKEGKLFKCERCPYEATQRSHLKRHMETHDIVKRFQCQQCDYSANTLGYMKIHYSRAHKGLQYSGQTAATATTTAMREKNASTSVCDSRVYKCVSCEYLFGNLSDLKRHLRIRHRVQVSDITGLDNMQTTEIQVLQYADGTSDTYATEVEETAMEGVQEFQVQETGVRQTLDETTASAVNLLQHIFSFSNQGQFSGQQITVQSEDGQMVAVNPDTIIVQEGGEEVLVTQGDGEGVEGGQYVIQYVAPEAALEGIPVQIQTEEEQVPQSQ